MVVLLVIDMQVGSFFDGSTRSANKFDPDGVISRINSLAQTVRAASGVVVFVQHDGPQGDAFEPGTRAWNILPELDRLTSDPVVHKHACDSFYETDLEDVLKGKGETELIITGSATEYCVDTTVRAAASLNYEVTVVADGHTTSDRSYLDAETIVCHHNTVWKDLILPRSSVQVENAASLIKRLSFGEPVRS